MASTSKRTFVFDDGSSRKFWEVEVAGDQLTTCWGRVGTRGQSKIKTFDSAAKARAERDKLVAEKLGKGYRAARPAATQAKVLMEPEQADALAASFDAFMEDWAERGGLP